MRIGVDFDNTIVRYDDLFHRVASEGGLVGPETPADKTAIRDALRRAGREDDWTRMQGVVYGTRIDEAEPFEGVLEFFAACREAGTPASIVSHKTRHPFLVAGSGPPPDLHAAARGWLDARGLAGAAAGVWFEGTKERKLARIGELGATVFIDDLPEFLLEPGFPAGVERILFDPARRYPESDAYRKASSWREIREALLGVRR